MVVKTIRKKKTNKTIQQELLVSFKQNDEKEGLGFDKTANETNGPL